MVSRPALPRTRRRLVALGLGIAVLAGACADDGEPEQYNADTEDNFVTACLEANTEDRDAEQASTDTRRYCECVYTTLEDEMPFEDFRDLDDELDEKAGDEITSLDQIDLPPNDVYVDALKSCNNPREAE